MKTPISQLQVPRRTFLKSAAAAGLAGQSARAFGQGRDRKRRVALVGCGWWGMNICRAALGEGGSTVVAVCDADRAAMAAAAAEIEKTSGSQPEQIPDYREMLEKAKPEIVIVATPDHWHPLITIAAVQAGAHVYVEKPVGHTIKEGRAMVSAARATERIVQVGTHRRVSPHNISGMEFLRSGKAGKIGHVECFIRYGGGAEAPETNAEAPEGLDWERWCGPAPLRPFNPKIHPKGFRNFLDYANGTIADWGIHWFDQVLWWTDEKYPRTVFSHGGRPVRGAVVNDGEAQTTDAPDHQVATFEFEGFTCSWENRNFGGNGAQKHEEVGCVFHGTNGTFHMGWKGGWTFYPTNSKTAPTHVGPQLHEPDSQNIRELWADFLRSIDDGTRPVCDIETGHLSTNMSLLAMLSMKLGRSVDWDGDQELCVSDPEANRLLSREYREGYSYPV